MKTVAYRLCPRCFRAVPLGSREQYCPNDGERLLTACRECGADISSPYAHYCVRCGQGFELHVVIRDEPQTILPERR